MALLRCASINHEVALDLPAHEQIVYELCYYYFATCASVQHKLLVKMLLYYLFVITYCRTSDGRARLPVYVQIIKQTALVL